MAESKPRVLVLGGLHTCSSALLNYLIPFEGEPLVSAVRVADKFSVTPPTTYLGSRVRRTLTHPIVEYQQANLLIPATVQAVFEPPEGQAPWDYVFDVTGEIRYDRPDEIQLEQTTKLVKSLGQEAARRNVKAYIRLTHPFYQTPLEKGTSKESEKLKPERVRGHWWHEALRALAAIPNLNLAIVRIGAAYGPQMLFGAGSVNSRIVVGRVYQYLEEEMKYLWSGGIRLNTIHSHDIARGLFAVAEWLAPLGREQANQIAGETLTHFPPSSKDKDKDEIKQLEKLAAEVCPLEIEPVAPLFNLVDDTDTTAQILGEAIAKTFGIKFSFWGLLASTAFNFKARTTIEDINEYHVNGWTSLIMSSSPPVPSTPITSYVEQHELAKYSVAYDASKIKQILGFKCEQPTFDENAVRDVIESFREEGTWPN